MRLLPANRSKRPSISLERERRIRESAVTASAASVLHREPQYRPDTQSGVRCCHRAWPGRRSRCCGFLQVTALYASRGQASIDSPGDTFVVRRRSNSWCASRCDQCGQHFSEFESPSRCVVSHDLARGSNRLWPIPAHTYARANTRFAPLLRVPIHRFAAHSVRHADRWHRAPAQQAAAFVSVISQLDRTRCSWPRAPQTHPIFSSIQARELAQAGGVGGLQPSQVDNGRACVGIR